MNQLVDREGTVLRVESLADWEVKRERALAAMQEVMGPLPGKARRVRLDVKVEEEVDAGKYFRQLITFHSEPGSRTPAYLCIPQSVFIVKGGKVPAVLCLHPTDNKVGHKVVLGLGGREGRHKLRDHR